MITSCGRVEDAELETLVRPDDEDGAAGQRKSGGISLVRIHHAVLCRDLTRRVRDDRVRELVQLVVGLQR